MRKNLPVTANEYVLNDNDIIVSKTDLKGKITYVNQEFLRISGFSEQEAMGAPHNLVRHPDMPEEAFDDLWKALKAGKSWTGVVKNRCKNGDCYWVEATVAPILEGTQTIGYTSIRTKPSREKVMASEAVYRSIKSGSREYKVQSGTAVKRSAFGWLNTMFKPTVKAKMVASSSLLTGLFIFIAFASSGTFSAFPNLTMGISILGAILSMTFCAKSCHDIVHTIERVRQNVDRMSAGDLSGHIASQGNDEFGDLVQSLRILQTNVKLLVGQIKESAHVVNSGSREIALGNADLSARTESQASSLEETASSMEELTSTVKINAENAREANSMVANAAQIAVAGGDAVRQMVTMMDSINESSRKIVDIIGVIDGIAFQTNILALNAAVEAARAGEQGRGFAVVASEVRNLAQRSAGAAKEIQGLITDSVQKVETGSRMVGNAGRTMDDIVNAVKQAAAIMGDISHASLEQSAGIEQVNVAVTQMDEATQQNSALVEQAAGAAATLQEQATKLVDLVGSFKLLSGHPAGSNLAAGRMAPDGEKNLLPV
jgi:aerotaxis receptor